MHNVDLMKVYGGLVMSALFIHLSRFVLLFMFLSISIFGSAGYVLASDTVRPMEKDYLIAPADVLEISIWGEPDLGRELVVRPDGKVSFPLIGDIEVAGKSTSQVKELVEKKIHAYIPEASATVIVSKLGSLQYFVIGKVGNPGIFNVSKPLTVLQALALAGGLSTFADEDNISIVRYRNGKSIRIPFDYGQVKGGKNLDQNILLERGDVVLVP